jgi:hypothetical protein
MKADEKDGLATTLTERYLVVDGVPLTLRALEQSGFAPLVHTRFEHLDAKLMAHVRPDTVLAPLIGSGFDILDLCDLLSVLGYRGRLVAFAPKLPDLRLVAAEVRAHAPGVAFEALEIDPA